MEDKIQVIKDFMAEMREINIERGRGDNLDRNDIREIEAMLDGLLNKPKPQYSVQHRRKFYKTVTVLEGSRTECERFADEQNLLLAEQGIRTWTEDYFVKPIYF